VITHQTTDRRIQRTRQLLQDALFQLLTERGYEEITIQDITEKANLGRTTFYLHYRDKEELLRASVKSLIHELQLNVEPDECEENAYLLKSIRIFQHVERRQKLYQSLLRETGPVNMGDLLRTYFAEQFHQYFLEPKNHGNLPSWNNNLIAAHAAGSLFGLISWWLNHHEAFLSAERMGAIYIQLMAEGGIDVSQDLP
jgi:AcrR family transcriptional regulator